MACTITLPFWPESIDCLSWSKSNQIAVVGGESVAILNPRLKDRASNGTFWETTLIKVNGFTIGELPFSDPLSGANFSIGEELSQRQAVSAVWSSPGLAHRRTCALAVLTANHVLSIWAPVGRPNADGNWKRRLIVNHAIKEYYACREQSDHNIGGRQQQQAERRQIQQRVRAFTWSSPLRRTPRDKELHWAGEWGEQFLVVATEAGDILFLQVQSPLTEALDWEPRWNVSIVGIFRVGDLISTAGLNRPEQQQFRPRIDSAEPPIADSVACGDMRYDQHGASTDIAFTCGGKLFTAAVQFSRHLDNVQVSIFDHESTRWQLREHDHMTGPLHFARVGASHLLLASGPDVVAAVDLAGSRLVQTHHLDGRWDATVGLSFTGVGDNDGSTCLHIASILSSSTAPTAALSLPWRDDHEDSSVDTIWRDAINGSKAAFDAEHDLNGKVLERTWGIASSPLQDFVVTCITLHPAESITYVISINQTCILNISPECPTITGDRAPDIEPSRDQYLPAEAILFSVQRCMELRNGPAAYSPEIVVNHVLAHTPSGPRVEDIAALSAETTEEQVRQLRLALYAPEEARKFRASRLAGVALRLSQPELIRNIVKRFVSVLLRLDHTVLEMDETSITIRRLFYTVHSRLEAPAASGTEQATAGDRVETCKICDDNIPFESLRWARCTRGHRFGRCALSFVATQDPGITKLCRICDQQYLDDDVVPELQRSPEDIVMREVPRAKVGSTVVTQSYMEVPRPRPTLAQLLFAACDLCVYCGGSFE